MNCVHQGPNQCMVKINRHEYVFDQLITSELSSYQNQGKSRGPCTLQVGQLVSALWENTQGMVGLLSDAVMETVSHSHSLSPVPQTL